MALPNTLTMLDLSVAHSRGPHLPDGLGLPHYGTAKPHFLPADMALFHVKCHLDLPLPPWTRLLLKKRTVGVGGRRPDGQAETAVRGCCLFCLRSK